MGRSGGRGRRLPPGPSVQEVIIINSYAPWPLPRRARTGSSATRCSAGRGYRCWRIRSVPESRARGPCSSNVRPCPDPRRRLYWGWWRPFAPSPRGTRGCPASDSRPRRTAGSRWRRNAFPRIQGGAETAGRLKREFNFSLLPGRGGQFREMNSRKNVTSSLSVSLSLFSFLLLYISLLLYKPSILVYGLFREKERESPFPLYFISLRDCAFNIPARNYFTVIRNFFFQLRAALRFISFARLHLLSGDFIFETKLMPESLRGSRKLREMKEGVKGKI